MKFLKHLFGSKTRTAVPAAEDGHSRRDAAIWAVRLFLGREPLSEEELALHATHGSLESLRTAFALTPEFQSFLQRTGAASAYRMPLFMLAPPADDRVPWLFAPPSLATPVSQLCTEAQFREPSFARWCRELDLVPRHHRKMWEFCYILAVLESVGALKPGARALGFGVGREPVPALLAKHGMSVVATDAPSNAAHTSQWAATKQHATALEAISHPAILPFEEMRELVAFRPVDMNAIPLDLRDFELCWSACALEHLGSLSHGLDFIEASLDTLKPGGIAVHTTEFNITSNESTFESPLLSLYRKCDIERLLARLAGAGHEVLPLNLFPGSSPVDQHIDLPPFGVEPHLKIKVLDFVTTSIGIAVRKAWT
jgi:hypothetical protein